MTDSATFRRTFEDAREALEVTALAGIRRIVFDATGEHTDFTIEACKGNAFYIDPGRLMDIDHNWIELHEDARRDLENALDGPLDDLSVAVNPADGSFEASTRSVDHHTPQISPRCQGQPPRTPCPNATV